ncbi:MAG TPA: hypothetical protein EYG60_04445 [Campylobacterales bacterium]|nr:hypothetical protein [Campylobacterales bacterium]
MLTALAVLLLSAVGGGIVGALLTSTYPADSICNQCKDKAECQQQILYERAIEYDNVESEQVREFPESEEQLEEMEYPEDTENEEQ